MCTAPTLPLSPLLVRIMQRELFQCDEQDESSEADHRCVGQRKSRPNSLWHAVVYFVLLASLLLAKLKDLLTTIWSTLAEECDDFFDAFASLTLESDCPCTLATTLTTAAVGIAPPESKERQILPFLPNVVTCAALWNKIWLLQSISLIFKLRRVSKGWCDFIGTTLEWTTLEFMRLDNPSYERFARRW